MFKKIWKDPVGSKLIAAGIIGVVTILGVWVKGYYSNESFYEALVWFLNLPIPLYFILSGVILVLVIIRIFRYRKQGYSPKQRKLREFNSSTDTEVNVRAEWTVYFNSKGKPFIADLEFYCLEHGSTPMRFYANRCTYKNCKNSKLSFNEFEIKNIYESLVLDEWNKIK